MIFAVQQPSVKRTVVHGEVGEVIDELWYSRDRLKLGGQSSQTNVTLLARYPNPKCNVPQSVDYFAVLA